MRLRIAQEEEESLVLKTVGSLFNALVWGVGIGIGYWIIHEKVGLKR